MKDGKLILVRHGYDDHSYIDGTNDTNLTKDGIKMAQDEAEKLLYKVNSDKIIIRHSVKIRAQETAEIICEHFFKNGIGCQCIKENGLTELFQGQFNFDGLTHQERVDFLQGCWDDFEECRKKGYLNHHFGQNKDRSIVIVPGENHYEWSTRIAKGVLNIIGDLEQSFQSINISHRGAILEIQKIVEMANGEIQPSEVEQYVTIWMSYCQDYLLHINDLNTAKVLIKKYIRQRSKNENNY